VYIRRLVLNLVFKISITPMVHFLVSADIVHKDYAPWATYCAPQWTNRKTLVLFSRNIGPTMEPSSRHSDEPLPQQEVSACGSLIVAGKNAEEASLKKREGKQIDHWSSNESCILSRVIIAIFLLSVLGQYKPWWFRVIYTTDGVNKSEGTVSSVWL
jgi:hypothetical protein